EEAGPDRRPLVQDLLAHRADGRIKMYLTMTALHLRRTHPDVFLQGEYVPLDSGGSRQDHLCAFARLRNEQAFVVVVPRLVAGLLAPSVAPPVGEEVWRDTWVTAPSWRTGSPYRNVVTGETLSSTTVDGERQGLRVADVLRDCPVALLERLA
ncbi:MAG: malto-oligosyltrehalose synthase, partial [Nitrospirales bacterium]